MKISDDTKKLCWKIGQSVFVNYVMYFTDLDLTIDNETIHEESVSITQAICDDDELTYGGCIASTCTFEVSEILANQIKGQIFTATIKLVDKDGNSVSDEDILMGTYKVNSATLVDDSDYKKIVAYDYMYDASADVADWYNSFFPIVSTTSSTSTDDDGNETTTTTNVYGTSTLKEFKTALLDHLCIEYVDQTLPNDDMVVEKTVTPTTGGLPGTTLLKMIAVLQGGFGIINRDGKYETICIGSNALFPEETLYPSEDLYPSDTYEYVGQNGETNECAEYKSVTYEEYICQPITCLNLSTDDEDIGCTVGSDTSNPYVISANYFLYGKTSDDLEIIGNNILSYYTGIYYRACTIEMQGLPYLELGCAVTLEKNTDDIETFMFSRELSGIQGLTDKITAQGEEYRDNEVSVNSEIEQLKSKTLKIMKTVDELSFNMTDLANGTESHFKQTDSDIETEVKRAGIAETKISQTVGEQGGEIVLKVNAAGKIVQVGLSSSAEDGAVFSVDADNINLSANDVIKLLANGTIDLTASNITITSDNWSVDKNGNMTANKGTFGGHLNGITGTFQYLCFGDLGDSCIQLGLDDDGNAIFVVGGSVATVMNSPHINDAYIYRLRAGNAENDENAQITVESPFGPIQSIGESHFSNGVYVDPYEGKSCASKFSGGMAADIVYTESTIGEEKTMVDVGAELTELSSSLASLSCKIFEAVTASISSESPTYSFPVKQGQVFMLQQRASGAVWIVKYNGQCKIVPDTNSTYAIAVSASNGTCTVSKGANYDVFDYKRLM